jgi:hypothetical protein
VSDFIDFEEVYFLHTLWNFLGHVVCKKGLLMDLAKIEMILYLEPPLSVIQLQETLCHTGYYRNFIKGYA